MYIENKYSYTANFVRNINRRAIAAVKIVERNKQMVSVLDELVVHVHEALEVLDSLDLELGGGVLVAHEYGARVHLKGAHRPHVVDALLDGHVESERLVSARDQYHDFACVHDGADADRERLSGHQAHVVVEEARVGVYGLLGERLEARARDKTRAGLVEGNVAVGSDAADEELDATGGLDRRLELLALARQVASVAVQYVHIARIDVDVLEEVLKHERMVAFRMISRQT